MVRAGADVTIAEHDSQWIGTLSCAVLVLHPVDEVLDRRLCLRQGNAGRATQWGDWSVGLCARHLACLSDEAMTLVSDDQD